VPVTDLSYSLPQAGQPNSTEEPKITTALGDIKGVWNQAHAIGGHPLSWLAGGSSGQLIVCNASGVPTYVTSSGDVTTDNAGALTIGSAKVTDAKLASPNNSVYKSVAETQIASAAGISASANAIGLSSATTWGAPPFSIGGVFGGFDFASGDYSVPGLTTKFRVKMQVFVSGTSPSTVTFNGGLYAATMSAGNLTPGTVVTGSTTGTTPTPVLSTNTIGRYTSSDFAASALLSDPGDYLLGFVVGSITVPAGIGVRMQLQSRNV
jgi:hypothetical protein